MDLPRGKDPDELIREDPAAWERHIAGATPVIDYVFAAVVARFDASTAQGKTTITRRLAPLIHNAESVFEQNERIAKLARMLKEEENVIRLAVGGLGGAKRGYRRGGPDLPAGSQVLSQPPRDLLEEYCLATLLHYPELAPQASDLEPEDFLKAQNREVFKALARAVPAESLKDQLDPAMHPDLDALFTLPLVPAPHWEREEALRDYVRRLQKRRVDMELEALQARYATGDISTEEAGAQAEVLIAERCRIDGVSPAGEIRPATGS
jgi:DNA primase